MSRLAGWRIALRLARREAGRARGRSLLVLVMIALPVLGVTAADVVARTASVSAHEGLDRRLGSAGAKVTFLGGGPVTQGFDPEKDGSNAFGGTAGTAAPTLGTIRAALGRGVEGVQINDGTARVRTRDGVADAAATEVDLSSRLARGLFTLSAGRLPASTREVVVSPALARRGPAPGDTLTLADGSIRSVVGLVESTALRDVPLVVGQVGSLGVEVPKGTSTWLVDAGQPITWPDVRRLNATGASVLSRSVIDHPPPESVLDQGFRQPGGLDSNTLSVLALVVTMALLEVVLLAGPAFAVGARRQQRSLALLGASGGTPRQMRRVVLANGVVLGAVAAVLGVLLGVGLARGALPFAQRFSTSVFGPFEVRLRDLVGIAAFGFLSAFLAAVAPAWVASHQDVVAVLSGRRGDRRPGVRSPLLGLLLLGAGVAGAVFGARNSSGENVIALAALLSVLGMILLVPVVVATLGRVARRAPLVLRYAVRDAARHRTRTVPAVAAVAATVAGVVALGIGLSSDAEQNRATYVPQVAIGDAAIVAPEASPADWIAFRRIVAGVLPEAKTQQVDGVSTWVRKHPEQSIEVMVSPPGIAPDKFSSTYLQSLGSGVLVDDGTGDLGALPLGLSGARLDRARGVLQAGGAVVFASAATAADQARITVQIYDANGDPKPGRTTTVSATYIVSGRGHAQAIIAPSAARAAHLPVAPVSILVHGQTITRAAEQDIRERLGSLSGHVQFTVERGYQGDGTTRVIQLVLAVLGAVLMLGGTLTATFLALSDARGDLATLSAVGASPRTRRGVAAAYALVIGGVGAVLGAVVGFVPGIAVSYPLTRPFGLDTGGPSHYLAVPWVLILALVLLLPVVTAAVVGLTARRGLPMVTRLD